MNNKAVVYGSSGEINATTLQIAGSAVTASAADINLIDGITNGTVAASKVIITDSNKDITGGRNITITGEMDAATLDLSGNADIDGTANLDAVDIDGAVDVAGVTTFNNKTLINSSAEDGGSGVTIPLTNHATFINTGGGETSTLLAGTEGQIKVIVMKADGGDMVITVTNAAWGGSSTITFDSVGDGVTLQYIDSKWYCIGSNGVVFG